MPTYLHPGVYIEEIPSGARAIEGVATSIAAFVGAARRGPTDQAVFVQNFDEYKATFGPIHSESDAMGLAVQAFYLNGGKVAYICRLVGSAPAGNASSTPLLGQDTAGVAVLTASASSPGAWGDDYMVRVIKPNTGDQSFGIEIGTVQDGKFILGESHLLLNMNEQDPNYALTRINRDSSLLRLATTAAAGTNAQKGTLTGAVLANAATLFTVGIHDGETLRVNVDGRGLRTIRLPSVATLALAGDNAGDGTKVAQAIAAAVQALGPTVAAYRDFTCTYEPTRQFKLTSGGPASSYSSVQVAAGDGSATDLATLLRLGPADNPTRVLGAAKIIPQQVLGPAGNGVPLVGGADSPPAAGNYTTFFTSVLKKVRDVGILVLPGATWTAAEHSIVDAAVAHCEDVRNRVLILDLAATVNLAQDADVVALGLPTSTYTVLYYPWVGVPNPFYSADTNPNAARTVAIAPSALAAGMYARIDGRRGVWKAPAGVETQLTGVAKLEKSIEDGEQDFLNPQGVNALRKLPGFGSVIWGARTLATRADPEWRYVPVRRTAIFIEQSIYNGIQWAVFEPNDHPLWSSLRANIGSFMNSMFRAGAFQGATANDAYFVRCGLGDTMTQGDIDRGQVIVVVGFAPLKPAEFVIIRVQQKVQQQ